MDARWSRIKVGNEINRLMSSFYSKNEEVGREDGESCRMNFMTAGNCAVER